MDFGIHKQPSFACLADISLMSRSKKVDLIYFIFLFIFIFFSIYFSIFLFLEQLGLGLIGHTVTVKITGHKTDHEAWENLVEDSRTDDIIQHRHHMLASWTTHGCLG